MLASIAIWANSAPGGRFKTCGQNTQTRLAYLAFNTGELIVFALFSQLVNDRGYGAIS